jgi:hypothetical protein
MDGVTMNRANRSTSSQHGGGGSIVGGVGVGASSGRAGSGLLRLDNHTLAIILTFIDVRSLLRLNAICTSLQWRLHLRSWIGEDDYYKRLLINTNIISATRTAPPKPSLVSALEKAKRLTQQSCKPLHYHLFRAIMMKARDQHVSSHRAALIRRYWPLIERISNRSSFMVYLCPLLSIILTTSSSPLWLRFAPLYALTIPLLPTWIIWLYIYWHLRHTPGFTDLPQLFDTHQRFPLPWHMLAYQLQLPPRVAYAAGGQRHEDDYKTLLAFPRYAQLAIPNASPLQLINIGIASIACMMITPLLHYYWNDISTASPWPLIATIWAMLISLGCVPVLASDYYYSSDDRKSWIGLMMTLSVQTLWWFNCLPYGHIHSWPTWLVGSIAGLIHGINQYRRVWACELAYWCTVIAVICTIWSWPKSEDSQHILRFSAGAAAIAGWIFAICVDRVLSLVF